MAYETNNKYLMHFNKNHDRLGRFSKGSGGHAPANTSRTSRGSEQFKNDFSSWLVTDRDRAGLKYSDYGKAASNLGKQQQKMVNKGRSYYNNIPNNSKQLKMQSAALMGIAAIGGLWLAYSLSQLA